MLIVLAAYFKRGVEYLLHLLEELRELRNALGLKKVPDKSTISREMRRIPEKRFSLSYPLAPEY